LIVLTKVEINGVPMVRGSNGEIYDPYDRDPETGALNGPPKDATVVHIGMLPGDRPIVLLGKNGERTEVES
jgi:hypothetical protein